MVMNRYEQYWRNTKWKRTCKMVQTHNEETTENLKMLQAKTMNGQTCKKIL